MMVPLENHLEEEGNGLGCEAGRGRGPGPRGPVREGAQIRLTAANEVDRLIVLKSCSRVCAVMSANSLLAGNSIEGVSIYR